MPTSPLCKLLRFVQFLLMALIVAASARFVTGLRIEQDNESMKSDQARNDPVYQHFKKVFDAEYEVMLAITREDLASADGTRAIDQAVDWLGGLEGIRTVFRGDDGALVSDDGKTQALLLTLDSAQSRKDRLALLKTLRTEAPQQIDGTVHVVGAPILKESVARHIARDQKVVTPLSVLMMMVMLALLFRRVSGVVLPMLVVGLSLLTTLGLYAGLGYELNSITSLLPAVVIVLAVSAAVHLYDAWLHSIDAGLHGRDAIRSAVSNVWKPCVFTAAMTAAGLLSLLISPITAVRLFGLFAAIGVSLSVFFAFVVLPAALAWTPERPAGGKASWMRHFLHAAAESAVRFPVVILLAALFITALSVWAGSRVENNTDLIRFFKKSDPTYIAHAAVNDSMGSVRSIDLLLHRTDGVAFDPFTDPAVLQPLLDQMENIPDVARVDSLLPYLQTAAPPAPDALGRFLADDGRVLRFQVHLGDIGSARAAEISSALEALAPEGWAVEPTGAYFQVVRDSNRLVDTLLKSFATTLVIVLVSTCLLFRTHRVLIPALIPNILPIIWGAGLMGLLHIDLSTGTTMVAAVVIGLAVDDTIHYLHHFQTFRHLPVHEATRATTRRIGRALTASSIVLVGGFWMGAFGSFIPTNTFALLTGGMMASALFCDLLVLPAWLNLTLRPQPREIPS